MKTYLFPGQGSQKKGMGAELFDEFPEITAKAEQILGYSVKTLCLTDPDNLLNETAYTQPALFTVSAMQWLKTVAEQGESDFVAGHSLGELNALFAAGAFDFATGLRLVKERSRLMSQTRSGGMAAVIGASEEEIDRILQAGGFQQVYFANYNSPQQIVISGAAEEIQQAAPLFKAERIIYKPLNVSGAFHTRFMQDAADAFKKILDQATFYELKIGVISNATAQPYGQKDTLADGLSHQMVSPVRWVDGIRYLMDQGCHEFIEVGPGNVLTKLMHKIKKAR